VQEHTSVSLETHASKHGPPQPSTTTTRTTVKRDSGRAFFNRHRTPLLPRSPGPRQVSRCAAQRHATPGGVNQSRHACRRGQGGDDQAASAGHGRARRRQAEFAAPASAETLQLRSYAARRVSPPRRKRSRPGGGRRACIHHLLSAPPHDAAAGALKRPRTVLQPPTRPPAPHLKPTCACLSWTYHHHRSADLVLDMIITCGI
jgi:hypothetical protein